MLDDHVCAVGPCIFFVVLSDLFGWTDLFLCLRRNEIEMRSFMHRYISVVSFSALLFPGPYSGRKSNALFFWKKNTFNFIFKKRQREREIQPPSVLLACLPFITFLGNGRKTESSLFGKEKDNSRSWTIALASIFFIAQVRVKFPCICIVLREGEGECSVVSDKGIGSRIVFPSLVGPQQIVVMFPKTRVGRYVV